jgi:DNA-binding transcriptional ArsR family regulator
MNKENKKLDNIFNALANKHRRDIVYRLSLQPSSISLLAKQEKLSLPAIHKHIRVMEDAKLLMRKKSGRCNFLALDRSALLVLKDWITQYHGYWGNNQESLENYVREIEKKNYT